MLIKLIKHEFRATGRTMLPVLGVVLTLAVLANVSFRSFEYAEVTFIKTLVGFIIGAFFIGMVAAGVVSLMVMINRFYKNVLGEEAYLTMTLPVSTHAIVWSKLIVSFVWFIVTGFVVAIVLFLTVANFSHMDLASVFSNMPPLSEILNNFYISSGFNAGTLAVFIIECFVLVFASALVVCLHFYASMAIGYGFKNKKTLMSVAAFIAISFLYQILTIYLSAGLASILEGIYYEVEMCTTMNRIVLSALAVQAVQGIILYFITILNLKMRLNLS